jgi:AraC family transcriptional regulator, alkane utilization regulator
MPTTDVLTDVLETVRVGAACYGRVEAAAPWGIGVEADEEDAKFHVVLSGECWLEVDGQEPVHLHGGDLVALPHGHAHSLRDVQSSPIRPLSELITVSGGKCQPSIVTGGQGAAATLVTGSFHFEDRRNNPLLSVLPPVIVLPGEMSRSVHWLEPTLKFIACEAQSGRPGAQTVVSRLADVLFIQIVRGYLSTLPPGASGWLGALGDSQIGSALGFIHQSPEQGWTVQSLAAKVAMSRSAFASRFARLVGEPPLAYVTRWRMQKAAGLLRQSSATLADIAERVGYDSEAAFSKAFKRAVGTAPGAYRRASKATVIAAAAAAA